MADLHVEVDATCISSGYCRRTAPGVFGAKPDLKSYVLVDPVPHTGELQDAMESCPVEAISAVDVTTGATVFPED